MALSAELAYKLNALEKRYDAQVKVVFQAIRELDERDATEIISGLKTADSAGRVRSAQTGEWLYVFRPRVADVVLYVKLALRSVCIVVSFH